MRCERRGSDAGGCFAGLALAAAMVAGAGCSGGRTEARAGESAVVGSAQSTLVATTAGVASPTPEPTVAPIAPAAAASVSTVSAPAEPFTPPQLGPGAKPEYDPETAPVVPEGASLAKYTERYYTAVVQKDWATARTMVPSIEPDLSAKDFAALQYGYELKSFSVISAVADGPEATAVVVHVTPSNGVWNVEWEFAKKGAGWVVKNLTYARPGGKGCH